MDETNISDEKKLLLDYKETLVRQIEACRRDIQDSLANYKSNRNFVDDSDSDSDNGLEQIRANLAEESSAELRSQCEQLQICLQATQELTGLQLYEKEVNVMVEPPQITERYKNEEVPEGLWREVQTECRVDLVPFSLTFYVHQPYAKLSAPSYHNVRVALVKEPHKRELAGSVLWDVEKPSDVVQVLRSYALAQRSRRTTLSKLADKYTDGQLSMNLLPNGGYLLTYGDLMKLSWKLENKWSPIAPFYHRMKFDLDYMDKQFVKTITQANHQLQDPAVGTDERTFLLSKIIDTCAMAKQNNQTEESVDSDTSQNVDNRRTTLDHGQLTHQEAMPERKRKRDKDSEVMAPPKSLPKKARKGDVQKRDDELVKKNAKSNVDGDKLRALKEKNSIFGTAKANEEFISGFDGQIGKGKYVKRDCAPNNKKRSEKTHSNLLKDTLKQKTNAANRIPDNKEGNNVVNVKKTTTTEKIGKTNQNVVQKDINKAKNTQSVVERIDRNADKDRVNHELDLIDHIERNAQRKINANVGDKNAERKKRNDIETANIVDQNNIRLEKNAQRKVNANDGDKNTEKRKRNDIDTANKVDQNNIRLEKNAQRKVNANDGDKNAERRKRNDIEIANKVDQNNIRIENNAQRKADANDGDKNADDIETANKIDQNNIRLGKNAQRKANANDGDKNAERRKRNDIETANKVDQNNIRLEKNAQKKVNANNGDKNAQRKNNAEENNARPKNTQKDREITDIVERNRDKDIDKAKKLAYKMSLQKAKLTNKNKFETLNKKRGLQEKFVKTTSENLKEAAKNLLRNNGNSQKSDPIRGMVANNPKKNQLQFENNARGSKHNVEMGKKLAKNSGHVAHKNMLMQKFSKIPQKVAKTRGSFENPLRNSPRLVKKNMNNGRSAGVNIVKPISKKVAK